MVNGCFIFECNSDLVVIVLSVDITFPFYNKEMFEKLVREKSISRFVQLHGGIEQCKVIIKLLGIRNSVGTVRLSMRTKVFVQ